MRVRSLGWEGIPYTAEAKPEPQLLNLCSSPGATRTEAHVPGALVHGKREATALRSRCLTVRELPCSPQPEGKPMGQPRPSTVRNKYIKQRCRWHDPKGPMKTSISIFYRCIMLLTFSHHHMEIAPTSGIISASITAV